jgi:signal transduction histidine kinase
VLPALGEIAALLALGDGGAVHLAGVATAEVSLEQRLSSQAGRPPQADGLASIIAEGRPRIMSGAQPFGPSVGIRAAMAAPIGSGAGPDALLFVGSTAPGRQYDAADLATLEVLAGLLTARRTLRELTRRETALRQQLEAGAQAGRLLAHRLNNDLTMPVGVVELLLDRGMAGSELQEMLEAASHDLAAMEQHIREFHDEMRTMGGVGSTPQPTAAHPGSPLR